MNHITELQEQLTTIAEALAPAMLEHARKFYQERGELCVFVFDLSRPWDPDSERWPTRAHPLSDFLFLVDKAGDYQKMLAACPAEMLIVGVAGSDMVVSAYSKYPGAVM